MRCDMCGNTLTDNDPIVVDVLVYQLAINSGEVDLSKHPDSKNFFNTPSRAAAPGEMVSIYPGILFDRFRQRVVCKRCSDDLDIIFKSRKKWWQFWK